MPQLIFFLLILGCLGTSVHPATAATRLSTDTPAMETDAQTRQQRPRRPKPARGSYDLAFDFYDGPDPDKATLIGSDNQFAIPLRQGRFAITLNIPPSLRHRREIWLNIQAAPGGTDHYINLSPRNLPVKTRKQNRVSSKLRVSGTILDKQGRLVLGPYETVWLLPKTSRPAVQIARPKATETPKPPPPANTLERIQRDLGLQPGQFLAHASLDLLWPLEQFRIYGGNQLLELIQPTNGQPVEQPPASLLFMMEMPDHDALALEALLHRESGFNLKLSWTDLHKEKIWLRVHLRDVHLREIHRLDDHLYSLRIEPGTFSLEYKTASTTPLVDNQGNHSH